MRPTMQNAPRTGPPRRPPPARGMLAAFAIVGLASFVLGLSLPAAGQPGEPVAGQAPAPGVLAVTAPEEPFTWSDQVVTVTPEGTDDPLPATVTPEGTEEPLPPTVTPEGTEEPLPPTVTEEPTEPPAVVDTPTPTLSATPTATPTRGMTCTPPPCPCGRLVGICPNIVCEVCTSTPTRTPTRTVTPSPTPSSGTLVNIATRGLVGTGGDILIGGFISRGAPVKVIIRGLGPSLGLPGTLADPLLRIFSGQTVIGENNNWQDGNCRAEAPEGLWPKDPREACLVMTLAPGPYTAHVLGVGGGTGVGFFDLNRSGAGGEFANVASRGLVGTGGDVLIAGLITRDRPTKVIFRGLGPSMGLPPVNLPGTLQDPLLQIFSGQTVIASNDNWQTGNCGTEAPEGLRPKDPREACLVITLPPGPYTAIVSGVGGTRGVGFVDVNKSGP